MGVAGGAATDQNSLFVGKTRRGKKGESGAVEEKSYALTD